ncbi:MAG: beta-N-acetylhexosaminidase [Rikenellaceae bacterium]
MRTKSLIMFITALLLICNAQAEELNLIPKPNSVVVNSGSFTFSPSAVIVAPKDLEPVACYFSELFIAPFGKPLSVARRASSSKSQIIELSLIKGMEQEEYKIEVTEQRIEIEASTVEGVFRGLQTLRQLMPVEAYATTKQESVEWSIPCVEISDAPRFEWRGLMVDSSRHFQPLLELLRMIDLMSHYKMNIFHWHLVDGHGWRMESALYPNLTEIGAWRMQPGYPTEGETNRYGGYYTQEEILLLVDYAKERFITVVPEIEMPGHSSAALASYPDLLACSNVEKVEVAHFYSYPATEQRFPPGGADVMCAGKESTFQFIDNIIGETCELFPSEYIHIGGDEVAKSQWANCPECQKRMEEEGLESLEELQSYFIKRAEKILSKYGRKLIGWDEILEGGLPEQSAVMSWRGVDGGVKAAQQGKKIVMSPEQYLYLDRGQSKSPLHPTHWPGYVPIDVVYNFNPVPQVLTNQGNEGLVMGLQGNLWTIFTNTQELNDIQTFPRLCAIAEIGWTNENQCSYDDFLKRLEIDKMRLDFQGVIYWQEPK